MYLFERRYHLYILCLIILCAGVRAVAQPDYDFRNPVRISGTNLQPGSTYRFSNVKTGTDAIVTYVQVTSGLVLVSLDGGSGYVEAFQPIVNAPSGANGFAEFRIDFVNTGTTIPRVMTEVPMTAIDVDGRVLDGGDLNKLFEYVSFSLNPAGNYFDYDKILGELNVTQTGNLVTGKNVPGVSYMNVDTSAKQVMFSAVNANVSSVTIRVGVENNRLAIEQRLNSIYFKKFEYANSFLSKSPIINFNAIRKNGGTELWWQLQSATSDSDASIVLQRSANGVDFVSISKEPIRTSGSYIDKVSTGRTVYYRLLFQTRQTFFYSSILTTTNACSTSFEIKGTPNKKFIQFFSSFEQQASVNIVDISGNVCFKRQVQLLKGFNRIELNFTRTQKTKVYVAILSSEGSRISKKFVF